MDREQMIATLVLHGFEPAWTGTRTVVWHPVRRKAYWVSRRYEPSVESSQYEKLPEAVSGWDWLTTEDLHILVNYWGVLHGE